MPKYTAKSYLLHNGEVFKTGDEIELTTEQAERLGDKVAIPGADSTNANDGGGETAGDAAGADTATTAAATASASPSSFESHTVEQLKEIAAAYGINGYSSMKKAELIEAIEARQ